MKYPQQIDVPVFSHENYFLLLLHITTLTYCAGGDDLKEAFEQVGVLYDHCSNVIPHHYYPMIWLGTARILYHMILRCRSPQCRDLPCVAMCILLLV